MHCCKAIHRAAANEAPTGGYNDLRGAVQLAPLVQLGVGDLHMTRLATGGRDGHRSGSG